MRLFEDLGALQIERAEGRWEDGVWADFDPTSTPNVIGGTRARGQGSAPNRHNAAH